MVCSLHELATCCCCWEYLCRTAPTSTKPAHTSLSDFIYNASHHLLVSVYRFLFASLVRNMYVMFIH